MENKNSNRLMSLDLLRGLDMIFLCVGAPLLCDVSGYTGIGKAIVKAQISHPWCGFTAYDMIMPLFIFMCGAAIPFALPKRLGADGRPTASFWKHVAGRVALLWFLGLVAQGRLLEFDLSRLSPFNNTLQTIACGYLIAALVLLVRSARVRIAIPIILAALYGLVFMVTGDYSPDHNIAIRFEEWFVKLIMPAGNCAFEIADPGYSWWFTIPMFGAMTLCGMNCTLILKSERTPWNKAAILGILGVVLWVVGYALELAGVPSIKHLFTVSFTAQAMGLSVLMLVALYVLTDIWNFRRGWWVVTLYGQTALAAYVLGEMFPQVILCAGKVLTFGLEKHIGERAMTMTVRIAASIVLTFFLYVWRRSRQAK